MKKLVTVVVVAALAFCIAGVAKAEKAKMKATVETPSDTLVVKTMDINKGKFTTEKGKIIDVSKNNGTDLTQGVRVETLTFKDKHSLKPGSDYVTLINDKNETIRPVAKGSKLDDLTNATNKKVKVYSTYNIQDAGWQVLHAEVLD